MNPMRIRGAGRGWRVLADGIILIVIGAVLPVAQHELLDVRIWRALAIICGTGLIVAVFRPWTWLRLSLSVAVPLVCGIRALALITTPDPTFLVGAAVWTILAFHVVAAVSPDSRDEL